jgi:hypothetical protein
LFHKEAQKAFLSGEDLEKIELRLEFAQNLGRNIIYYVLM